jgi:hypothetical protein
MLREFESETPKKGYDVGDVGKTFKCILGKGFRALNLEFGFNFICMHQFVKNFFLKLTGDIF